jgi:hypothetical protein
MRASFVVVSVVLFVSCVCGLYLTILCILVSFFLSRLYEMVLVVVLVSIVIGYVVRFVCIQILLLFIFLIFFVSLILCV